MFWLFVCLMLILYLFFLTPRFVVRIAESVYPDVLFRVPGIRKNRVKKIAITIDDAPYGESFETIVNILKQHNHKVSFFVIRGMIDTLKKKQLLIDCISTGHQLCNHGTSDTPHYKLSESQLLKQISQCDESLDTLYREADTEPVVKWYRPGSGFINKTIQKVSKDQGVRLALGSVYPHDPFVRFPLLNFLNITSRIQDGDILIIHDREWTPGLLDKLLPWLTDHGFESVTLDELVRHRQTHGFE